ncbi:deoxynucleoside kinase [Jeotgalibaca sp. MA1X17-3]|uniref:deoxynucleoside kinase n=1 Tax=Jeotgalibaca sp. MA1X17-3 TaxID=2908211 RepID=UPI001F441101|nr:deoxynucleoside kinase [Jeotgalibaca sp. MA1X17-3]UJF16615.1 deoxynucleoside kinase [Jeotgalibaca sp. MA1X17-3]
MSVIVMAGMIGAGKSSYTEMISRRLGTEAFYESVEYNPVLDKFYENPKQWAFSLQIFFLNARFKSIKDALSDDNNVLDRSIYEDELFTRINHLQGNISSIEMDIYNDLLANMMEELKGTPKKSPDLLVYLHGSFEKILAHIEKRGRDFEKVEVGDDRYNYFKLLWTEYQNWYESYDHSPKIAISIDEFDIVEFPEQEDVVMNIIEKALEDIRIPLHV